MMPEEVKNAPNTPAGGDTPETTSEAGATTPPASVPYDRFSTVIQERNDAQKKLEAAEREKEAARLKKLEEDGDLTKVNEALAQQNEKLRNENEAHREFEADRRRTLTEQLPEDQREFTTGMSLLQLEKFVAKQTAAPAEPETPGEERTVPTGDAPAPQAGEKPKGYHDMTQEEREANWPQILKGYQTRG